jgi:RNA polymerase sigma-70 factor (ECF subfamily)
MIKDLADDLVDITDQELVQKCQLGDASSFRFLYQRYQNRVRSTLYQLCGLDMLDDLVQEVFLRAWKGLPKLRQSSYFSTWLYRITWNVANDTRRQFFKIQQQKELLQNNSESISSLNQAELMQLHYQDLVQKGLQSLNFDHRAVLVLHDLEDIPQKEVATILDIPVGTVKSRLFNARKSIRNFLEKQGVSL